MRMYINGVYYHVEVIGQGPSLLLLHGFTGSIESWKPFVNDWSKEYQLILVDILGHGESENPEFSSRYEISKIADDLNDILKQLNIIKTHVLGYSMGGRLALTFAILYEDKLHSLILESASPGLKTKEERENRVQSDHALADKVEQEGIEAFIDYWEKIPLFATQQVLPASVLQHVREQRLKNKTIGLANSLRGMGTGSQPSWWESLHQIKVPVLIMVGDKDQKFYHIGQQMKDYFPNSNLQVVQDAGHTIHLEQPKIYSNLIKNHLNKYKEGN